MHAYMHTLQKHDKAYKYKNMFCHVNYIFLSGSKYLQPSEGACIVSYLN